MDTTIPRRQALIMLAAASAIPFGGSFLCNALAAAIDDQPAGSVKRPMATLLTTKTKFSNDPKAADKRPSKPEDIFQISLAQWSLHDAFYKKTLDHLDFPKVAKETYNIDAVEYVNTFFAKKGDGAYVNELHKRCTDLGVKSVLIMCDGEGLIGDPDETKRAKTVDNHQKWLDAAKILGCHCIRVNAGSEGSYDEQKLLAADGLHQLCDRADKLDLDVIVENHGGLSSDGKWLAEVMTLTDHPRVGTLPDFGNFTIAKGKEYDPYQGVTDMIPYAKGVSAKSHDFDLKTGEETRKDYGRLMRLVYRAGYRGRVGIEYEGKILSQPDGVRATKTLLEKVRAEIFAEVTKA